MTKKKAPDTKHTYEIQLNMPTNKMWATMHRDKLHKPDALIMHAKTLNENTVYRVMDTTTGKVVWTSNEKEK
jgi:hypothetical protein